MTNKIKENIKNAIRYLNYDYTNHTPNLPLVFRYGRFTIVSIPLEIINKEVWKGDLYIFYNELCIMKIYRSYGQYDFIRLINLNKLSQLILNYVTAILDDICYPFVINKGVYQDKHLTIIKNLQDFKEKKYEDGMIIYQNGYMKFEII